MSCDSSSHVCPCCSLGLWNTSAAMPKLQYLNASNCPGIVGDLGVELASSVLVYDGSNTGIWAALPNDTG